VIENNPTWAITGWVVAGLGFFGLIIRSIGPWRKQISETEERLRKELSDALATERATNAATLATERAAHAAELRQHALERDEMGDRIDKLERMLDRQQIRHNAERSLDRHRLNNINQCFDALLLLLKANPEKSAEAVTMIEEMRAKQLVAEAEEKAIIRAAEIARDDGENDHDGN
jgi:uncharacterized membrane protein YheB (UPF0754 family)